MSKSQVERDIAELSLAGQLDRPERVVGLGGMTYPAKVAERRSALLVRSDAPA